MLYVVKDGNVYDGSPMASQVRRFIGTLRPDGGIDFCPKERAMKAARLNDERQAHIMTAHNRPLICAPPGGYYTTPATTPVRSTSPVSTVGSPEWRAAMNSCPPPLLPEVPCCILANRANMLLPQLALANRAKVWLDIKDTKDRDIAMLEAEIAQLQAKVASLRSS